MASEQVELFDLASKDGNVCWSLNPWKARLVLNYKKIPYHTTWLEYPDIASTLKALGVPPNPTSYPYTSPAVRLPDGTGVMESEAIAAALEKLHPSPSLHLGIPLQKEADDWVAGFRSSLGGVLIPKIPGNLLSEQSADYFERTRKEMFGMPLSEVGKAKGGEDAWEKAESHLKAGGDMFKKNGGPFLQGETVTFADMIIIGAIQFAKRIDGSIYERIVSIEPALGKLMDASKDLLERDNH